MQPEPSVAIARNDPLIGQLDPERNYGDLDFDGVLDGIGAGTILIEPGQRLPVLRSSTTGRTIKGSGQPPQAGVSTQQAALREFRERAIDDLPEAYGLLLKGMRADDPRFHKIFFENLLGKMGENRGGDAVARAFMALIEAMQKPDERYIESTESG